MDKAKETIAIRNNELMSKLKDIKDSQEALRAVSYTHLAMAADSTGVEVTLWCS